jgi:hypothetical protein
MWGITSFFFFDDSTVSSFAGTLNIKQTVVCIYHKMSAKEANVVMYDNIW